MQTTMCSRCGKRVAVVFITRIEGGQTKNEGFCLRCARELHIKPVDDMIGKMDLSDEDLDTLSGEMMTALNGAENLMGIGEQEDSGDEEDKEDDGKTATFPFLNRLFGGGGGGQSEPRDEDSSRQEPSSPKAAKYKFLDSYCINLSRRA